MLADRKELKETRKIIHWMWRQITTNGRNTHCKSHFKVQMEQKAAFLLPLHHWKCVFALWQNKIGGLPITLHTSDSIRLQHISRETLTPERAGRVDTSVVTDVTLIHQALIYVRHNRTLNCISPIQFLTNGEGLSRERAVRYYSTQRMWWN